jgi:hypothetical protein
MSMITATTPLQWGCSGRRLSTSRISGKVYGDDSPTVGLQRPEAQYVSNKRGRCTATTPLQWGCSGRRLSTSRISVEGVLADLAWCLRAWSGFGGCVWFFGFLCELIVLGLVLVFPETPRSLGRAPVWSPALREVTPASELCALRLFSKTGLGP